MKLLKMGSNKSENGEDATQKLKNSCEKSDIVECRSPKNVETIYTKFKVYD